MTKKNEYDYFKELLSGILPISKRHRNLSITGFKALQGEKYKSELMVVGRAVNGWAPGIMLSELESREKRAQYSKFIYQKGNDDCPMEWVVKPQDVKKYNPNRSAFWRVVKSIVDVLEIADVEKDIWSSHIVWSNLYKLAPEKGGNPSESFCKKQFSGCLSLLKYEFEHYLPKRLLFLTGLNWAEPFLKGLSYNQIKNKPGLVKQIGKIQLESHIIDCVIASHPQGKPEKEWVNEVVSNFRAF